MTNLRSKLEKYKSEGRSDLCHQLLNLPVNLAKSEQPERLCQFLTRFDFIEAKIHYLSMSALITDYELMQTPGLPMDAEMAADLQVVRNALQLSSQILSEDKNQLAAQLVGRLGGEPGRLVQNLLEQIQSRHHQVWLRPLTPSLASPSSFLSTTLQGCFSPLVITPDGQHIISASLDGELKLWHLKTGEIIRSFVDCGLVEWLIVLPDRDRLLSIVADGLLKIWNLNNGGSVRAMTNNSGPLAGLSLSSDGRHALLVGCSGSFSIWNLEKGEKLQELVNLLPVVERAVLIPDKNRVICIEPDCLFGANKILKIRDLEDGQELFTLGEPSPLIEVSVTPRSRLVISAALDHQQQAQISLWQIETGKEQYRYQIDDAAINALAVTPDERLLIASTDLGSIRIWDLETCNELNITLHAHDLPISQLSITPDGKQLLSSSLDGVIKIWDLQDISRKTWRGSHQDRITAIVVTPDGKQAISAARDNTIKIWDVESATEKYSFEHQPLFVNALAITPDSKRVIASSEIFLSVYDLETKKILHILEYPDLITQVAFTKNGKFAVSIADNNVLSVWDLESGTQVYSLLIPTGNKVCRLDITHDSSLIIAAIDSTQSELQYLNVWDLETGALQIVLKAHTASVQQLASTPDSKTLISCSSNEIRFWDLNNGVELFSAKGYTTLITSIAIMSDGQKFISASGDGCIKVWDLLNGALLYEFSDFPNPIIGIAVTPDGERMISHWSNSLKVWDLQTQACIARFTTDTGITTYAIASDGLTFVVGETSGQLHILYLEDCSELAIDSVLTS
jgi:WD40 repeat protein